MAFVQVMEFTSKRPEDVDSLMAEWWAETEGRGTVRQEIVGRDRDRRDHYVTVVEFPSAEVAQRNSARPQTRDFARALGELAEGPVEYRDYDVLR